MSDGDFMIWLNSLEKFGLIPFGLDKAIIMSKFYDQEKRCLISKFAFGNGNFLPLFFKLNESLPYGPDNFGLACSFILNFKGQMKLEDFKQLCFIIATADLATADGLNVLDVRFNNFQETGVLNNA